VRGPDEDRSPLRRLGRWARRDRDYDRALGGADRAAQRSARRLERRGRRDIQSTVRRFIDLSSVVLEAHDSGTGVLRLIERRIGSSGCARIWGALKASLARNSRRTLTC
jgi:hypothetical protein